MYRVLAIVLMASAICYPRIAAETEANSDPFGRGPSRADLLLADFSDWLRQPLDRILAALNNPPPG